jgi:hypothetical protein
MQSSVQPGRAQGVSRALSGVTGGVIVIQGADPGYHHEGYPAALHLIEHREANAGFPF